MIEIVIGGIGYGLLLSLMVGPAFFILIETSITKGIKSALYLDLGVLISDLVYVTVAFLFFQEVHALMEGDNQSILRVIGGGCFMLFGLNNLRKNRKSNFIAKKHKVNPQSLRASNYVMTIIKGFMINALNPGVLFYWLTLMSILPAAPESLKLTPMQTQMIYIAIILITFFGVDVLKIIGAKKLKDFLTPNWIRVLNVVLGVILIVFGTFFLIRGVFELLK